MKSAGLPGFFVTRLRVFLWRMKVPIQRGESSPQFQQTKRVTLLLWTPDVAQSLDAPVERRRPGGLPDTCPGLDTCILLLWTKTKLLQTVSARNLLDSYMIAPLNTQARVRVYINEAEKYRPIQREGRFVQQKQPETQALLRNTHRQTK